VGIIKTYLNIKVMSEFKGTKGKWTISKSRNGHALISGDDWEDFCKIYRITDGGDFDKSGEMQLANAKLIACSPEMLDMLERCSYWIANCSEEAKITKEIEQLIKKATS